MYAPATHPPHSTTTPTRTHLVRAKGGADAIQLGRKAAAAVEDGKDGLGAGRALLVEELAGDVREADDGVARARAEDDARKALLLRGGHDARDVLEGHARAARLAVAARQRARLRVAGGQARRLIPPAARAAR